MDMQEFVAGWKISKQFTLDVANAKPAEFEDLNPNPKEMTFGKQIVHFAFSNVFRSHQITGIQPPFPTDMSKTPPTDKESAVKALEQSFLYVIAVLQYVTPEQLKRTWKIPSRKIRTQPEGRAMIVNMFVHPAHHRAQCEVCLRVKGSEPSDYAFQRFTFASCTSFGREASLMVNRKSSQERSSLSAFLSVCSAKTVDSACAWTSESPKIILAATELFTGSSALISRAATFARPESYLEWKGTHN